MLPRFACTTAVACGGFAGKARPQTTSSPRSLGITGSSTASPSSGASVFHMSTSVSTAGALSRSKKTSGVRTRKDSPSRSKVRVSSPTL